MIHFTKNKVLYLYSDKCSSFNFNKKGRVFSLPFFIIKITSKKTA